MRLDTRVSRATRIEVVTEGVLTRLLQEDPALEQVACLIFDEYHERSLAADLGLALAIGRAQRNWEAAFRILIMSATLECERVAALLGDAASRERAGPGISGARLQYVGSGRRRLPDFDADPIERAVARGRAARARQRSAATCWSFCPAPVEIRRVETLLRDGADAAEHVAAAAVRRYGGARRRMRC